jgi:hypothetical protein
LKFIAFIGLLFLAGACFDNGDCLVDNSNVIKVNLKKKSDSKEQKITFSSVDVEGTDIKLYQNKEVSALELPVNPNSTMTTFILNYDSVSQRLTVAYTNETRISAPDCGAFLYHTNLSITETTFDSTALRIVNRDLLQNVEVNFEILF